MRRGPDAGGTLHAPLRTKAPSILTRRDFEEIAEKSNQRVRFDVSWDFLGKFASGFGEGLATRATGTPTGVAQVANTLGGEISMTLAATNEAEFSGVDWTDIKQIGATWLPYFVARVKTPVAAVAAAEDVVIGLATDYNATLNSISKYLRFRLSGSNALLIEGNDGTTANNAVATGRTLGLSEYNMFTIEQKIGDGRYYFFLNDDLVGTLAQSAFVSTDLFQPLVGIRKASGVTVPVLTMDYLRVASNRL
jgi:hypothetical protein